MSTLLRVTMSDQLDLPVRQAGESKLEVNKKFSRGLAGQLKKKNLNIKYNS